MWPGPSWARLSCITDVIMLMGVAVIPPIKKAYWLLFNSECFSMTASILSLTLHMHAFHTASSRVTGRNLKESLIRGVMTPSRKRSGVSPSRMPLMSGMSFSSMSSGAYR